MECNNSNRECNNKVDTNNKAPNFKGRELTNSNRADMGDNNQISNNKDQ